MVRSTGFGSITSDKSLYSSSLSLWLRYLYLNLPLTITRRNILQQARSQTLSRSPSVCKLAISRSISLPSRGSFHLSLTVLVHYRSYIIFSLGRWSCRIQTRFLVPRPTRGNTDKVNAAFAYTTLTSFG